MRIALCGVPALPAGSTGPAPRGCILEETGQPAPAPVVLEPVTQHLPQRGSHQVGGQLVFPGEPHGVCIAFVVPTSPHPRCKGSKIPYTPRSSRIQGAVSFVHAPPLTRRIAIRDSLVSVGFGAMMVCPSPSDPLPESRWPRSPLC
jgi:hypothetical protein